MYNWTHGLEDSIEWVTHSIYPLEFENHRPLNDWFLYQLGVFRSQRIEFARLNLEYTVMNNRKLIELVRRYWQARGRFRSAIENTLTRSQA